MTLQRAATYQNMSKPVYILSSIPNGTAGVRATLAVMSDIVKTYRKNPTIRELALRLVQDVPQKQWRGEANAIFSFVRDNIRYVKDINGVETLHTPVELLRLRQGDCDDKSILAASLLESIGHPARFIACGFIPGHYSHVFSQTKIAGKWITLECTMQDWPLGRCPKGIKSYMIQHIPKVR
jgi:transglutaminase-like putative cysteine protease